MTRRAVSIADVALAFARLAPADDDERAAIARLLGFDTAAPPDPGIIAPADARRPIPPPVGAPVAPPPAAPAPPPTEGEARTELVRMPDVVHLDVVLAAPLPPAQPPAWRAPAPSLLAPEWAGVALARLGARLARTGPLDVDRLVDHVARRSAIRVMPRHLRMTTAPAVTIVLDRSGVMPWLADDQARLVLELDAVLRVPLEIVVAGGPPDVVEPIAAPRRDDRPRRDGAGDDPLAAIDVRRPAVRAAHGTRVIAVTDLGAGSAWDDPRERTVLRWRGFADDLAARGATLIILTPLPSSRVPALLRDIPRVHWDRRTRPSQVHALVKALR